MLQKLTNFPGIQGPVVIIVMDGYGLPKTDVGSANFLPDLQRELIAVISKYVKVNPDDIRVSLEKQDRYEVLEVKIELPEKA